MPDQTQSAAFACLTGGCERSQALFNSAKALIPGGVNSPARAFGAVLTTPSTQEQMNKLPKTP